MILRIKFSKKGALRFIGHLDIMRFFQKTVRRSGIDVKYSNGFNPHQIMSFAAPLGVGLESEGEYFDLEMNSVTTADDIKDRLNTCMPEGIEILSVKMLPEKAMNVMASVGAADYTVHFYEDRLPSFSLEEAVQKFQASETVEVQKHTKKTDAMTDLKPAVYSISASDTEKCVSFRVNASSAGNIKPLYVIQALYQFYGLTITQNDLKIMRLDTLLGPEYNFAPLDFAAAEWRNE